MSLKTYAYFTSNFEGFGLHVGSPRGVIFIMSLASFLLFFPIRAQDMPQAAPRRCKRLLRRTEDPQERSSAPQNAPKTSPKTSPRAQNTPKTSPRGSQDGFSRGPGQFEFGWKCFHRFLTYFTHSNPQKCRFSLSILKVMFGLLEGFLYLHYPNAQL